MSDAEQSPSILIISNDQELVESIISNGKESQRFVARESVEETINENGLLDNNGIIIFDIATVDNNVEMAIDKTIKLKQTDPTQILLMLGDKEPLAQILKSNIQPLLFRAFNKPFSPGQLGLAFTTAQSLHLDLVAKKEAGEDITAFGPAENRMNVDTLAEQRKPNTVVFAVIGLAVVGIIAWFLLAGSGDDEQQIVQSTAESVDSIEADFTNNLSEDINRTNELNQLAADALLEGRYILPKGNNAAEYYDQVLAIDPYDSTAYEGKKSVADLLRVSFADALSAADFDEALTIAEAIQKLEPLNIENDKLNDQLKAAISERVKTVQESGTAEEIAATSASLKKIEDKFDGAKSASNALQAEKELIAKIDASLAANNLYPPKKNNAYSLISNALKGNKISQVNAQTRITNLNEKLLAVAKNQLKEDDFETATKLSALIKRLNVDNQDIVELNKAIAARKAEVAEATAKEKVEAEKVAIEEAAVPEPPKIVPAKIVSREAPRYPSRAVKNQIEGWVEISFSIDTKGLPFDLKVLSSEPEGIFDKAALKSVQKWRFSPARNQNTGLPVESRIASTKVRFALN